MEMVRALSRVKLGCSHSSSLFTLLANSLGTDDYRTITIARTDGEDIEDEENKWKELGLQNAG